jgi:hypothetical protein
VAAAGSAFAEVVLGAADVDASADAEEDSVSVLLSLEHAERPTTASAAMVAAVRVLR